jgi:hypothetical protein
LAAVSHRLGDGVDRRPVEWVRRTRVRGFHLLEDFAAQHRDTAWRIDAEFHTLTVNGQHGDGDVISNQQALIHFAAQDEHA